MDLSFLLALFAQPSLRLSPGESLTADGKKISLDPPKEGCTLLMSRETWDHAESVLRELEQKLKGVGPFVCLDCSLHEASPVPDPLPGDYVCPHWRPEYWARKGYERHWGDAAIAHWPDMEILRKEEEGESWKKICYVILAPKILRRPVEISADGGSQMHSWGSY
jgi:hypothetical protein